MKTKVRVYWPICVVGILLILWGMTEIIIGGPIHFLRGPYTKGFPDLSIYNVSAGLGLFIVSIVPSLLKKKDLLAREFGLFLLLLGGFVFFGSIITMVIQAH